MITPKRITNEEIRNGKYNSADFAPQAWQVPDAFRRHSEFWTSAASDLMWLGAAAITRVMPKAGINRDEALLHVAAVLHANDLTVEHRELVAGYLLSEWFDQVETSVGTTAGLGAQQQTSVEQMPFAANLC